MSDEYKINQAGIVAPHSHFNTVQIGQKYGEVPSDMDLVALADELRELRSMLTNRVQDSSQYALIGEVMSAETAARDNDREKTTDHLRGLKGAGKWVLDAATSVGTGLAEAAIKASIGLV